ncbi:MAG: hypothetical protein R3F65_03170 [bacterium]
MTDDELRALLAPGATLVIDTNVSRSSRVMLELLKLAGDLAAHAIDLRLVVPAPAFAEILMDLRDRFGAHYDPSMIDDYIRDNTRLTIAPFTDADADHMAARLAARYGTDADWQRAKIETAFHELKLADRITTLHHPKARCSATIDWLIGSQTHRAGWILITDDTGPEFTDLPHRARFKQLRRVLATFPPAP